MLDHIPLFCCQIAVISHFSSPEYIVPFSSGFVAFIEYGFLLAKLKNQKGADYQ
jgi:hypothetical protein